MSDKIGVDGLLLVDKRQCPSVALELVTHGAVGMGLVELPSMVAFDACQAKLAFDT